MKVDILNPRLEWRRVILAPIKTGEAATPGNDRALKIAPATAPLPSYILTRGFADFGPHFQKDRPQIHPRSRLGSPLV